MIACGSFNFIKRLLKVPRKKKQVFDKDLFRSYAKFQGVNG